MEASNGDDDEGKFVIRPIRADEIDLVPQWIYKEAGWTTNDATFLKVCYDIDPRGWLVAFNKKDGIIGTVLSANMDHAYSFAGLFLVSKAYRFHGIGKILWSKMLAHVGTRCLGINSVKERVSANLKMGMSQPLFKVSIFNGKINRRSPLLDFSEIKRQFTAINKQSSTNQRNAIMSSDSDHSTFNDNNNANGINRGDHNLQNSKSRDGQMESTKADNPKAVGKQFYKSISTDLNNNYIINGDIEIREESPSDAAGSITPSLERKHNYDECVRKHGVGGTGFFQTLNTRSADLQRYTLKIPTDNNFYKIMTTNSSHDIQITNDISSTKIGATIYFMDGVDVDFNALLKYDTGIHGKVPRDKFLRSYLVMSTEPDFRNKVRCIVALKKTTTNIESSNEGISKTIVGDERNTICGYGIIRPRTQPHADNKPNEHRRMSRDQSQNTTDLHHDPSSMYFAIGPLYSDTPLIAHALIIALLESVPPEWDINLEMTIPLKLQTAKSAIKAETEQPEAKEETGMELKTNKPFISMGDSNFLYAAATKDLGLEIEIECYRMYQNNIPERFADGTLTRPEELVKQSTTYNCDPTAHLDSTNHAPNTTHCDQTNRDLVLYPELPIDKIYSLVSSDMFLD